MKFYYKRHLPHIILKDSIFFITTRLYGSLPKNIIEQMQKKYNDEIKLISGYNDNTTKVLRYREAKQKYFNSFDEALHTSSCGNNLLKENNLIIL